MASEADHKRFLQMAIDEAVKAVESGVGGPFGAVVVDANGQVVCAVHNELFLTNDPTAHAEVTAIRRACAQRENFELADCTLYTSCYPCPMCLCACLWAKIKHVYYAATPELAAEYHFHDKEFYEFMENRDHKMCKLDSISMQDVAKPFKTWEAKPDKVTY